MITWRGLGCSATVLVATLGCSHSYEVVETGCPYAREGTTSVVVREADSRTAVEEGGALVVRVRLGIPAAPAIQGALVSLHADTAIGDVQASIRRGVTDSTGLVVLDSVLPGSYGFLVRRIGYDLARHVVRLRQGRTDSVDVTLATNPLCLTQ